MKPALLLALLALAGAARARADGDDFKYYYEEIYAPFFEPIPGRPGWLRSARRGANPSEFEAEKPAGVFRVFIIGGSTAGGYTGAGALQLGLERALPGRRVEVINCGMSGYDSDRERLVLEQAARYQPDAVVTISGHNDFGIHRPPLPAWQRFLARSPVFERLRALLGVEAPQGEQMTPALRVQNLERLLRNLDAHVDTIERAGARAVVCAPPVDYEELAPQDGVPPWGDAAFSEGWAAFAKGQNARAEAAWLGRLRASPEPDDELAGALWHAIGRARERLGRRGEALDAYRRALDSTAGMDVCGPACLDAERALARRRGAVLADADAEFIEASRPRLPGAELFVDEIHWNPARHALVTRAIVDALRADPALSKLGWSRSALDAAPTPEDERAHRRGLLFYAVQRIDFHRNFSQRALEWLEAVDRLEPSWTKSPEALMARARAVYDEYDNRRPGGLYRSPLERRELPRARLLGYWGAMRLEQGRFRDARKALLEAARLESWTGDFILLEGAADALDRRLDDARRAFARVDERPEARGLALALGVTPK